MLGRVAGEELLYDAQRDTTWRILTAAEAPGSKVTHMVRVKGTQDGERLGGEKPKVRLFEVYRAMLTIYVYSWRCREAGVAT